MWRKRKKRQGYEISDYNALSEARSHQCQRVATSTVVIIWIIMEEEERMRKCSTYLVSRYSVFQTGVAVWVEVVGPDEYPFLAGRTGEWSNAGHDVADNFSRLEGIHKPFMLCL